MAMKLVVKKTRSFLRGTRWYYVLIGANGEPMMHSEQVHNKADAYDAARSVKENVGDAVITIDDSEAY